jgi:hypothetical protein
VPAKAVDVPGEPLGVDGCCGLYGQHRKKRGVDLHGRGGADEGADLIRDRLGIVVPGKRQAVLTSM